MELPLVVVPVPNRLFMFVLPVLLPVTPGTVGPKLVVPMLSAGVLALLPLPDTSACVVPL